MTTLQQTRLSTTPIATTLMLVAALALGGLGGYALSAVGQSHDATPAASAVEPHRIVNPGIGLHRTDGELSGRAVSAPDAETHGPVGGHNPGIGLHRLDVEALP